MVLAVLAEQLQYLPDGSEIPDETNCQFEGDQRVKYTVECAPCCHETCMTSQSSRAAESRWVDRLQDALGLPDEGVRPVLEDILLAKMRPGQTIELEAHCTKGAVRHGW